MDRGRVQVLIGTPEDMPQQAEKKFEILVKNVFRGSEPHVTFVRTIQDFVTHVNSAVYDLIFCVDDIGIGNEYATCIGKNIGTAKHIIVVPDSCYGYVQLGNLINSGHENILYQKDFNVLNVRCLMQGERTKEEALAYCGMDLKPVTQQTYQEKDGTEQRIQKKYLGGGMSVTRLCGHDARLLKNVGIGEDDVIASVLNGEVELDSELTDVMSYKEFEQEAGWIQGYKDKLRVHFRKEGLMTFQAFENGDVSRANFETTILKKLADYKLDQENAKLVCESFMRDTLSYGKLDSLITCDDISDIRLLNRNTVNVQYHGVWYRTNIHFETEEEYVYFINRMCTLNHAAVNIREADTVFTDIHTFTGYILRITVTHSLLSTASTYSAHIRISPRKKKTAKELIAENFWTKEQAAFITTAARKKKSIIIGGESGAGKTILLNQIIEYLDPSICGTCVQESDELHSESHPNMEFLHSVTAKGEGGVEYSLKRIATRALLKNAEVFIVGEIKGDEATDFFTASRTSTVYASTHSDDCFGILPRITELAKYNADYSQRDILRIMSENIDYVVQCENYSVKQIAGVVGYDMERDDVIYDLYEFGVKEEG